MDIIIVHYVIVIVHYVIIIVCVFQWASRMVGMPSQPCHSLHSMLFYSLPPYSVILAMWGVQVIN